MGNSFQISFNGQYQYKTYSGAFISISLFALLIIGIVYFGKEVVLKENPFVIPTFQTYQNFKRKNITNDELFVMIGVQDPSYVYYVDDGVYELNGLFYGYDVDEQGRQNWYFNPFKPVLCNTIYENKDLEAALPDFTYDLSLFWCLPKNDETNYMEGFFGANHLRTAQFILSKCTNSTTNNKKCKSEEYVNKILQGGVIAVQSNKFILDSKNLTSPLKKTAVDTWQILNLNMEIDLFFYMKTLEFETDIGFLLPEFEKYTKYDYDDPKVVYLLKDKINDNILSKVAFQGSNKGSKFMRKYEKIQDIVTKIGGLLKFLVAIGQVVSFTTSYVEFNNDIIFNLTEYHKQESFSANSILKNLEKKFSNNNLKEIKVNIENKESDNSIHISKFRSNRLKKMNLENEENKNEMSNQNINEINQSRIQNENRNLNSQNQVNNVKKNVEISPIDNKSLNHKYDEYILNLDDSNDYIDCCSHFIRFFEGIYHVTFGFCFDSFKKKKINLVNTNLSKIISFESIIKTHFFTEFLKNNLEKIDSEGKLIQNYNRMDLFAEYERILLSEY